jgi:deazaflavin-dependent oxidoreductase (nitroreductase family)
MANETLPRWLGPASRVNLWLLRRGLRIGTQHILSVPGRRTGVMRSTPVSVVTHDETRYIVSGEGLAWVANARAARWATLERGRRTERVTLTEIPPAERGAVLRAFWYQVPQGRSFIARLFGLAGNAGPDDFEDAAPRCPVFRVGGGQQSPA